MMNDQDSIIIKMDFLDTIKFVHDQDTILHEQCKDQNISIAKLKDSLPSATADGVAFKSSRSLERITAIWRHYGEEVN